MSQPHSDAVDTGTATKNKLTATLLRTPPLWLHIVCIQFNTATHFWLDNPVDLQLWSVSDPKDNFIGWWTALILAATL